MQLITTRMRLMPTTRKEHEIVNYDCVQVQRTVEVHRTFLLRVSRDGTVTSRAPGGTNCTGRDDCTVATHHPASTTYDWTRCEFLKQMKAAADAAGRS